MSNTSFNNSKPQVPSTEKVCPNCRTINGIEAKRCYSCGFDFVAHEEMLKKIEGAKKQPRKEQVVIEDTHEDNKKVFPSKTPLLVKSSIVLVVVIGLTLLLNFFSGGKEDKKENTYTGKNAQYSEIYDFWCENMKSQWVVHDIAAIDDIKFEKDDDGYHATIPFTADNLVEETIQAKAYCTAYINDEDELVEKFSGCYDIPEDDEEEQNNEDRNRKPEKDQATEDNAKSNDNSNTSNSSSENQSSTNSGTPATGVIPDLSLYTANYNMVVREGPDYSANEIRTIKKGEIVQILDMNGSINGSVWGMIENNQWVCLEDNDYIYFQKSS